MSRLRLWNDAGHPSLRVPVSPESFVVVVAKVLLSIELALYTRFSQKWTPFKDMVGSPYGICSGDVLRGVVNGGEAGPGT